MGTYAGDAVFGKDEARAAAALVGAVRVDALTGRTRVHLVAAFVNVLVFVSRRTHSHEHVKFSKPQCCHLTIAKKFSVTNFGHSFQNFLPRFYTLTVE